MPEEKPEANDDPWLTVSEVAEELRLNPATIRLWISKGQLTAVRAGPRRLLIKRSDLDRTLEILRGERQWLGDIEGNMEGPWQVRQLPPMSSDQLVAVDRTNPSVEPDEVGRVLEGLKRADDAWRGSQRYWLSRTSSTSGFEWKPISDGSNLQISHELREGAIRPGRPALWNQFDFAVGALSHALEHGPLASVVRPFQSLEDPPDFIGLNARIGPIYRDELVA
jgi:excisionase family DNA binding protein